MLIFRCRGAPPEKRRAEMDKGTVHIYCGKGKGKTTAAIGQAIKAACEGRNVVIIEFLKAKEEDELGFLKRLEPEIKIFRFEKMEKCYEQLNDQEKEEENNNILNALNFARKVIATQECDFLLLDEILGLLDYGIATEEALEEILKLKDDSMHIILTGRVLPEGLRKYADSVTTLTTELLHCDKQ